MTYIIALPCVDVMDRICIDEYLVGCIYESEWMLYIYPDECVDYGAYEPVYSTEAIYCRDNLSEEWSVLESVNVELSDDIGSPGGAQRLGLTGSNYLYVAGPPP